MLMNTALHIRYDELYSNIEPARCRDFLVSLSNTSRFEDETWVCEKKIKSVSQNANDVSIYFSKTPLPYKEMVKYYSLMRLQKGIGIKTVCNEVWSLNRFLIFLGEVPITDVAVMTAGEFKIYLDRKSYAESTRGSIWSALERFFRMMNGFEGLRLRNPFGENHYESHRLVDSKYIPDDVAKQLDHAFSNDRIPLHLRCIYWLLRLVPSRISEILGMTIDCLKPFDDHFCLFIPSWKQNGGYREPIMRTIHIHDRDMGARLLALIREQQKAANSYQGYVPEEKKNALFTYRRQIILNGIIHFKNQYRAATWAHVSYSFDRICRDAGIHDETGGYRVTSHQFRHNGITDRLRAGFTLPQIADMTGHHGTAMIYNSYTHLELYPETLTEPRAYTTDNPASGNPYILFGGRILNMDAVMEARLLRNLRAHRIPGGICADVTHCRSRMWDCIDCPQFVPEQEQLSFFMEQAAAWREKSLKFGADKLMADNFADIADRFQNVVEKLQQRGGMRNEQKDTTNAAQ